MLTGMAVVELATGNIFTKYIDPLSKLGTKVKT